MADEITGKSIKVAAVQMVSGKDIAANLVSAERLITNAAEAGAEVVLLPENFAYFGGKETVHLGEGEITAQGRIRSFVAEQAKKHGLILVAGSIPTSAPNQHGDTPEKGKVFTSSFVCSPEGLEVGRYDKMHLFDVDVSDEQGRYRESATYSPGDSPQVVHLGEFTLGLSICYDLRFPEYYRALLDLGANVLMVPAAFTSVTGEAHWEPLLRSRAIENQCYVIAANQGGVHGEKRKTWGHSCIISPWGEVLASLDKGEGVIVADIESHNVNALRESIPALKHRRL